MTVERVQGNVRDEGKAKRVEGMTPDGFRCLLVLVLLRVTIGVLTANVPKSTLRMSLVKPQLGKAEGAYDR